MSFVICKVGWLGLQLHGTYYILHMDLFCFWSGTWIGNGFTHQNTNWRLFKMNV